MSQQQRQGHDLGGNDELWPDIYLLAYLSFEPFWCAPFLWVAPCIGRPRRGISFLEWAVYSERERHRAAGIYTGVSMKRGWPRKIIKALFLLGLGGGGLEWGGGGVETRLWPQVSNAYTAGVLDNFYG